MIGRSEPRARAVWCSRRGRFASRSLAAMAATGADGLGVAAAGVRDAAVGVDRRGRRAGRPALVRPAARPPRKGGPDVAKVARLIHRPWGELGLPAAGLADIVVHTDTSGAGDQVLGSLQAAAYEMRTAVRVAEALAERAGA